MRRKTRFTGVEYAFMVYFLHMRRLQRDAKYFKETKSFRYNASFLKSMLAMALQPLMAWLSSLCLMLHIFFQTSKLAWLFGMCAVLEIFAFRE